MLFALQLKLFLLKLECITTRRGADVELKDADYFTPLMVACRFGHFETITCLLKHGADVTETDKDDKTCLMWASEENRAEVITVIRMSVSIISSSFLMSPQ